MPLPKDFIEHLAAVRPDLDAASLHRTFVSHTGPTRTSDGNAFLDWLHGQGSLSGGELAEFHASSRVALATVDMRAAAGAVQESDEPRYDKLHVVGAGAMGEVHIAKDLRLRRCVAFKAMKERAQREGHAQRFLREVQITAQLEHPQIVPVYDLELGGKTPAFTMKLVEGRDLSTLIEEARELNENGTSVDNAHSLQARLEHFLKVCDAVHYAHDKGVVHRDLKPSNIRVGGHNEVYVLDWGVARLLDDTDDSVQESGAAASVELSDDALDVDATREGMVVGTLAYMAPEQAEARPDVDARADQYALGLILYEMVTLRRARPRRGWPEVLALAVQGTYPPVEHAVSGRAVADELQAIIGKALNREPDARYPSVAALADDLRNWLRGMETQALPDRGLRKLKRWLGQHRRWALGTLVPCALVVPVAAALAITGWSSYSKGQETVDALSGALRDEITSRILSELDDFVSVPRLANEAHIARVKHGHVTLDDLRAWRMSLLGITQLWPDLGWTQFGAADGRYVGVEHRGDDTRIFSAADADTDWRSFIWEMSTEGELGELTREGPYDPRERPWYQAAAQAGEPRWSEPYYYFSAPVLAMSLAHPYRDGAGELAGVFASDRTLADISAFLRDQEVGQTGQTFIFDRAGFVIATSAEVPETRERIRPAQIDDPGVRAAAAHLTERFGDLTRVSGAEQWSFSLGDERYLAQMAPFSDDYGLDWTVVVVIPESDFMSRIDAHARDTVLLGAGVLLFAVLLGGILAFRVRERAE